jgi:hypothetical protein
MNEDDEFLTYFPEYKESFAEMREKLDTFMDQLDTQQYDYDKFRDSFETRKDLALWAKKQKDPNFIFQLADSKAKSPSEYIKKLKIDNLLKRIW